MTVYRVLEGFMSKRLAHRIVRLNALVCIQAALDAPLLTSITCRRCDRTELIEVPSYRVDELFSATSMRGDDIVIEALGNCHGDKCPYRPEE